MDHPVTHDEARAALDTVQNGRRRIIAEIDLPRWYWWGLAGGWVLLGVVSDLGHPWVTSGATLAFGALHASVAPHVIDGRHRTRNLSVSSDVVGRHVARVVIIGLVILTAVTVAAALAVNADGARHPSIIASTFVAAIVAVGGPQLLAGIRSRAARAAAPA